MDSLKLTLECFLRQEKGLFTFNSTLFFFNEMYNNMKNRINHLRTICPRIGTTCLRIGCSTSTIFFKITEKPLAFYQLQSQTKLVGKVVQLNSSPF